MNIPVPHTDEMIYGFLKRVANENCFVDIRELLEDPDVAVSHKVPKADGFSYGMFDVVDIPGIEPIMQMTVLPPLIPLMSRGYASRYIRATCSMRPGKTVLSFRPGNPLIDHIKRCPLCDAKASYIRWWHCVPGVEVCAEHGIPLVEQAQNSAGEILCHEISPAPMAHEYATFVKEFGESNPKFFLQETLPVLKHKILSFEEETGKHFVTYLESLGLDTAATGVSFVQKYIEPSDNILPFKETLTALMILYGSAKNFVSDVTAESHKKRVMQAIKGRFELLSQYDERVVWLKCLECGRVFASTPHSILTGWGCPVEDSKFTEKELFKKLFDTVNDGYILLSQFTTFQSNIRVKHKATGKVFDVMPDRFINFPHSCLGGKEPLSENEIRKEVEKDGNYILHSISRGATSKGIHIDITHKACGSRYSLTLTKFRRRSGCQQCNAISPYGTLPFGPFLVCGCGSRIGEISEAVEGRSRTDRREDNARLLTAVASFGDEPFFLEDITISDKRFIANTVSRLARNSELRRLGSGVYCSVSANPSFSDIVDAKFVIRHGKRRGFHCGTTLLRDIGMVLNDDIPTVVTMTPDKACNTQTYNLCGRKVRVIKSHIPITEENWKPLAVLFTLRHLNEAAIVDRKTLDVVLSRWMSFMGIGFADIVPYRDAFTARVFNDAVKLIRRAA